MRARAMTARSRSCSVAARRGCHTTAAPCRSACSRSSPREWYEAGRMLLRLWLAATRCGVVLQPFGSVITNPTAHARLGERIDRSEQPVWLLLRLGYSAEPPESARLPVRELLL